MSRSLARPAPRRLLGALGILPLLGLGGCLLGPYWDQETVSLDPIRPQEPIREVVVSDLYFSRDATTSSTSNNMIMLREAISIDDMSAEMAAHLRREGIPAIARVNVLPESLDEGQVLLRGTFQSSRYSANLPVNVLLGVFSASLIGYVLPSPLPYDHGDESFFRVELIDRHGNILMDDSDTMTGYYRDFWFWTGTNYGKREQALSREVPPRVAAAVASILRDAGADEVASAARSP